jgi:HEAT repeat protein/outer membrane protein assembly factor BamB
MEPSVFLEEDEELLRMLAAAEALEAGRDREKTLSAYQEVIDRAGASRALLPWNPRFHVPARTFARWRLRGLKPALADAYRRRFGPLASRMLQGGIEKGDSPLLRETALRFPLTLAASRALEAAGGICLERGDFLGAGSHLCRLLAEYDLSPARRASASLAMLSAAAQAQAASGFSDLLAPFKGSADRGMLRRGGREFPLKRLLAMTCAAAEAREAGSWPCHGGRPTRDRAGKTAVEFKAAVWRHRNAFDVEVGGIAPGVAAAADRERIYILDPARLAALNRRTGKLVWMREFNLTSLPEPAGPRPGFPGRDPSLRNPGIPVPGLCLHRGVLCFTRDGTRLLGADAATGETIFSLDRGDLRKIFNLPFEGRVSPHLTATRNTLFLGYHTAGFMQRSYVLALDLEKRTARWCSYLFSRSHPQPHDQTLALCRGTLMVCTNQGGLASVDLHDGSVRWIRTYTAASAGWKGFHLFARENSFFAAPADGDFLLCADAVTGEAAWRMPRGANTLIVPASEGLWIAGGGGAVLLGSDGRARKSLTLEGEEPRGTGASTRTQALLPSETGLWVLDGTKAAPDRILLPQGFMPDLVIPFEEGILCVGSRGAVMLGPPGPSPPAAEIPTALEGLIAALGSPRWPVRDEAAQRIRKLGEGSLPGLKKAYPHPDPETNWRLGTLIFSIERSVKRKRWKSHLSSACWEKLVKDNAVEGLLHRDPRKRIAGLRMLSMLSEPADSVVRDFLQDPSLEVALAAAVALFHGGDEAMLPRITTALGNPSPDIRGTALRALAGSKDPRAFPYLEAALSDADAAVRRVAIQGIAAMGKPVDPKNLARVLSDPEPAVRALAIRLFAPQATEAFFVRLVDIVTREKNEEVRLAAVVALGGRECRHSVVGLTRALSDASLSIRGTAADKLFDVIQSKAHVHAPLEGLAKGLAAGEPEIRFTVVQIVGLIPGRRANALLIAALGDAEFQIARHAMEVLFSKAGPEDLPALAPFVGHKNDDMRFYLVQVAERIGEPFAGPMLLGFLEDPLAEVRERAAEAVGRSTSPITLAGAFRLRVTSGRNEVKKLCKGILDSLGPDRFLGALVYALKDADEKVREEAAERLCKEARRKFGFLPADPSILRNEAADRWMEWYHRRLDPGFDPDALLRDLDGSNPTARWQAARRLGGIRIRRVVSALVARLEKEKVPWVLGETLGALQRTAALSFGTNPQTPAKDLPAILGKWKAWWGENKKYY